MKGVEVAGSVLAAFSSNHMNQIKFKTQFCGFWMLMKIIIVYASPLGKCNQVFQIHVYIAFYVVLSVVIIEYRLN